MIYNKLKPRYEEITPKVIDNVKSGDELFKQSKYGYDNLISNLDDVIELSGGKISKVYKGTINNLHKVVKISSGEYRIIELRREALALKLIAEQGKQHLVPKFIDYNDFGESACLTLEYVQGITVRDKLSLCKNELERSQVWISVGEVLSSLHSLHQESDVAHAWINNQLMIAEANMEKGLLDPEEFNEMCSEEMLSWLINNKPLRESVCLTHGDFRTKNIIIDDLKCSAIDWGFVDIGDPYYDLAIIDYYFKSQADRDSFYSGYAANKYDKELIKYYDRLSKFINV